MGASLSQEHSSEFQTAKVISLNGELHEYELPISVASVLVSEESFSSSSIPSSPSFVLCDSDKLYDEEYIPVLELTERLVENQIYFVLSRSRLQHKLAASEMAALAVKANAAMQEAADEGGTRRRKTRISPVLEVIAAEDETEGSEVKEKKIGNGGLARSGTVRQLRRNPSRRFKKAARSFRIQLSTIHEGSTI